jgi:hypothetical protein
MQAVVLVQIRRALERDGLPQAHVPAWAEKYGVSERSLRRWITDVRRDWR